MARTLKAKAVTVATVENMATDAEIRNGVETADVVALAAAPEPETASVADAAEVVAEAVSAPEAEAETAAQAEATTVPAHGTELFIPLNKLKKSPRNARKIPHTQADIEAYAASIAAKGVFQNLVVEPELDADEKPTGFYFVTIGESRRLAQLLRVKRKEIRRTEPVRCVVDTENDPFEISLDENVNRAAMHPADQFEAFRTLADNRGWRAEEIAARFGVTAHVVKQRMRLGAVSPKLLQVYRDGGLNLDQLMAFAITDDHARQEQVYANLHYNKDASIIRRDLTATTVPATDRRAIFIGADAYEKAGGTIIRDLFTEDRGGYFSNAALLDELVVTELEKIAHSRRKEEGWKWWQASIDYPHGHGCRRVYPHPVELSAEEEAIRAAAKEKHAALSEKWEGADELPPKVAKRLQRLEEEIANIDARRHAYDPDDLNRGGLFVVLKRRLDLNPATSDDNFFPPPSALHREQKSRRRPPSTAFPPCGCGPIVPSLSTIIEIAMGAVRSAEGNHVMATIGTFSRTDNGFAGSVKTLNLNVKAVKFVPAEGDNQNGPDFRVFAGATEFGAAWRKQSVQGNPYLSVKLDDPSFPAPIYASLVETDTEELALIWSRRRAVN